MTYYYLITEHSEEKFSYRLTSALNHGLNGKHAGEDYWKTVGGWEIEGNISVSATSGKDTRGYSYDSAVFSILLSLKQKNKTIKDNRK